ncbi:hypothetical protein M501DRAFT_1015021 [Patellaria atrata CBS 101060]|uniref:Uncharacterized protein n=1 Tax=Patellaria atrata CBS 101060 TaxID=1346257 RepID=A0A9P4VT27_9PEZI|nr:hypothetical protein M501DRAFT_1015021 [Patellaria atrata CBS 101060]
MPVFRQVEEPVEVSEISRAEFIARMKERGWWYDGQTKDPRSGPGSDEMASSTSRSQKVRETYQIEPNEIWKICLRAELAGFGDEELSREICGPPRMNSMLDKPELKKLTRDQYIRFKALENKLVEKNLYIQNHASELSRTTYGTQFDIQAFEEIAELTSGKKGRGKRKQNGNETEPVPGAHNTGMSWVSREWRDVERRLGRRTFGDDHVWTD